MKLLYIKNFIRAWRDALNPKIFALGDAIECETFGRGKVAWKSNDHLMCKFEDGHLIAYDAYGRGIVSGEKTLKHVKTTQPCKSK